MGRRRYRKKKTTAPFYAAVILLLIGCALFYRTEKPSAMPEQTEEDRKWFENAWIVSAEENTLIFMADGILMQVYADGVSEIRDTLADIEVRNGRAVKIGIKEDKIRGRVLAVGVDFIEIEGYGRLPLSESFAAYQIYGELTQKDYKSILVGYDAQEFIVGDGKVCGAVIKEEVEAALIRVLLKGNQYEGDVHEKVAVRSSEGMLLEYGEEQRRIEPETEVVFDISSQELSGGRIRLTTESEEGMIMITSLVRAQGNPSYYGSLEISRQDNGLMVVNEVELEKYLYFVVPSEMPASYGLEALKAQAVCARSYAWRHVMANSLSEQGAHVDDSSGFQVYNNYPADTVCSQAVDETRGQIMVYMGEIADAYYFSTSCGYTTDADIWSSEFSLPYIQGRRVWKEAEAEETEFAAAITDWDFPAYDREFPWYRWYVNIPLSALQACVEAAGLGEALGNVKGLEVSVRGKNGVAKAITITGEKGSAVIEKEYQIRKFLSPSGLELHRRDGEVLTDFALLPSGFFLVREILEDGAVTGYRIDGGGFGHGAGMSQNAAKAMAEEGNSYLDILQFFYQGVEIESTAAVQ